MEAGDEAKSTDGERQEEEKGKMREGRGARE